MKRGFILCFLLSVLILPVVHAELKIEKSTITDIVAKELSQPAKFSLKITNPSANADSFEFITYVDAIISPRGNVQIAGGETQEITLEVYPQQKLKDRIRGSYTFVYYLKTSSGFL